VLSFGACTKDASTPVSPNLPATSYNYGAANGKDKIAPASWTNSNSINNTIGGSKPAILNINTTDGGATLGRVIFFDNVTSLSMTNTCNRCHATPPRMASPKADGYAVIQTASGNSASIRNEMPRYSGNSGVNTQANIQASAHSGLVSAEALVQRMRAKTYYTQLFKEAFGTSDITPERINEALAQYASAASHNTAEELSRDVRFSDPFSK
jgi:cytochrome c peroxidase